MSLEKTIYTELSPDNLKELQKTLLENQVIIIKFGATWCGPCKKIKDLCNLCFSKMPDQVICLDLDVDDNFELYGQLKVKKMITGIPKIMAFYGSNKARDNWYIPDDSVSGTNIKEINLFFDKVYRYVMFPNKDVLSKTV